MAEPTHPENEASPPPVTPAELRNPRLSQQALGFHRGRTEELLGRAADALERLGAELVELRRERSGWEKERARLEARLELETERAERVLGQIMVEAHEAADAVRAEAQAEAETVRTQAQTFLAPVQAEAERLLEEARRQAAEIVAEAERERDRLEAAGDLARSLVDSIRRHTLATLRDAIARVDGLDEPVAPEAEEPAAEHEPEPAGDGQAVLRTRG